MKFKVDSMPYFSDECPFCETSFYGNHDMCRLDNELCVYFRGGKERNPMHCRFLIDDETERLLKGEGEEK